MISYLYELFFCCSSTIRTVLMDQNSEGYILQLKLEANLFSFEIHDRFKQRRGKIIEAENLTWNRITGNSTELVIYIFISS